MTLATLPAPRTWAPGDLVTTPRLRADITNAVAFLAQKPVFIGQYADGAGWNSGTDGQLGITSELVDNWGMHSTGTQDQYMYCQVPGWYLCRVSFPFQYTSLTTTVFAAGFQWTNNGTGHGPFRGPLLWWGNGFDPQPQALDLIPQTLTGPPGGSGDWIAATGFQNSGSAIGRDADTGLLPTVQVRWACALSGTVPLPVPPLTPVPSPITSAWLNSDVRDTIRFLLYPPAARISVASGSLPNNAATVVPFSSNDLDTYGAATTGANAAFTAPVAGRYLCYGQISVATSSSAFTVGCGLSVNGGTVQWGDQLYKTSDNFGSGAMILRRLRLNAGDKVQVMGFQNSGSALGYNAGTASQSRAVFLWEAA